MNLGRRRHRFDRDDLRHPVRNEATGAYEVKLMAGAAGPTAARDEAPLLLSFAGQVHVVTS